jgi:hypothetical protein
VTGMQENEDPRGEAEARAALVCSWIVAENHSANVQGRAQEGPGVVDGSVREQREVSRVGGAKQVVMALVTVRVRSRLHNHVEIRRGTHFPCAIADVSLEKGLQGREQNDK